MTQHPSQEQTDEDRRTLKRLGTVIGLFFLATIILAVSVGLVIG